MAGFRDLFLRSVGRIAKDVVRVGARQLGVDTGTTTRRSRQSAKERQAPRLSRRYPGDYRGEVFPTYDPHPGELPDPGEVVWAWVPYEEDHSQGKDRPVLIIGRDADWLLGLPMSSVNHDLDAAQEASEGRYWVEIGRGPWDARRRKPSAVRVDRVVRVHPDDVRRNGGRLDRDRFEQVAQGVRRHNG